jgi:hypothetical protein
MAAGSEAWASRFDHRHCTVRDILFTIFVRSPHQAVVGMTFLDIWIPAPDLPEGIYDHVEMIDPADIARVDLLETGASPIVT